MTYSLGIKERLHVTMVGIVLVLAIAQVRSIWSCRKDMYMGPSCMQLWVPHDLWLDRVGRLVTLENIRPLRFGI
ncbi:hypothetical protein EJF18_20754 [Clavispora lusitaniae]|uniref:Uncharacterized protein n=1 Tax=Clavispora lusitaniae TaxID=36911 RepID=A0ACD0WHB3_CLALS|nr:hypothetical protein EJF14_20754 [Clavispora lusitaniae]QFZ32503.1 hypothetical protein EJF16_20754 [Clavispora lusitaniae]QFZ38172.1 hypothetical protein EJF15_20754 [Clavispora lusitaniae]QFZ43855.1 hypothetical protein EJF18_20754 [Clavispora lusitaniae]QFZ49532.1 hypothetical protein EJF17_20754 [Clavispora lusitaniae]